MDEWNGASWTRQWFFALAACVAVLAGAGCGTKEFPEAIRQTLSAKAADLSAGPLSALYADSRQGSLLVVMTYGFGCSGSGPGNGLRDVAEMIRQRFPDQRVITRAWNDDDQIAQVIQNHPGPVALVGHSFGGSKSVEIAKGVGRPIDWLVLLDPVPSEDWVFRHPGKYFNIPNSVRNVVCFYRPPGAWPISYSVANPASSSVNRQRALGHSAFGENAEVRDYILNFCATEAAKVLSTAKSKGPEGGAAKTHS